jgi:prepilin-type N-terminal cleavage/methylation domain-containing protein
VKTSRSRRSQNFASRGFTLTELLVVSLIMGVVFSIAIPLYQASQDYAKRKTCEANLSAIVQAEEAYRVRNRAYTTTLTDLAASLGGPPTCPTGNAAYTVTTSGSGSSLTITVLCNNTGGHTASKKLQTTDGATFTLVDP